MPQALQRVRNVGAQLVARQRRQDERPVRMVATPAMMPVNMRCSTT